MDFPRVKIGVGEKPKGYDLADYVLGHFTKEEQAIFAERFDEVYDAVQPVSYTHLKDQTITATASYKKSETSKAFKLNAKTNGNGKLTYTTSNKAVATVDAAGKVTVKGPGVAKITVKACLLYTSRCV